MNRSNQIMKSNSDDQVQNFVANFFKSFWKHLKMKKWTGVILILFFCGNFVSGAVQRRLQENSWVCHILYMIYKAIGSFNVALFSDTRTLKIQYQYAQIKCGCR